MSMEVITMIGSVVTIVIAMFGCFGWFANQMDTRIAQLEVKMDARFAAVDERFVAVDARFVAFDARFDARFDAQDEKLGARFDRVDDRLLAVEHAVTEVKVAIARLEGPPRHLIPVR
ncbi:hypothetical protein SRABI76_02598 [Microbacterium oxydans]|nr:hypothetical protein SRABI76_02598 [Microbacterium oxydans]